MFNKNQVGPFCHRALPEKMACIKDGCVRWQVAPAEKEVNGKPQNVMHGDCGDNWQLLYLKAIAFRTDGTQIAVEQFRNDTARGNAAIIELFRGHVPQRDALVFDQSPKKE